MVTLGHIEKELERLETRANALAQDYYRWAKASGKFVKLRVRVRRINGTLRIEWSVPSWLFLGTDAQVRSRHLAKGAGESYPTRRLSRHVQPELRAKVLEYEDRFAEIRKAAKLLGQMKRLVKQYEQQVSKIEGNQNGQCYSAQNAY